MTFTARKSVSIVDDSALSVMRSASCSSKKRTLKYAEKRRTEKEGIDKAQELRPDLIVLDLSIPVMNGFDAARVLKRLMPAVPLILYSAFGDKLAEHQARLIEISEIVSKSEYPSALIHEARGLLYSAAA